MKTAQQNKGSFIAEPKPQGEIRKIEMGDLSRLADLLATCKSDDPYLVSAAYHGFTGRLGLWMYSEGSDFILFSLHPNTPEKILIFSGLSTRGAELAKNLVKSSFFPGSSFQLARLKAEQAAEAVTFLSWTTAGYDYAVCEEPVLDWLFPVHILSTDLVCQHTGQKFKDFRKNTHRVDAKRISIEPLDIRAHYFDLMSLSLTWAKDHFSESYSIDDLFKPHATIIKMLRDSDLDLRGSVIFMDGRCVSFAVWEMPSASDLPAISIASLSHGPSKGLSELQYLEMCKSLKDAGVARVCIGGSETASLDAYKRKMNPVESVSLKSVSAMRRFAEQALNTAGLSSLSK